MRSRLLLALIATWLAASMAAAQVASSQKPNPGVSDAYLASLGTAAPTFLVRRLEDPAEEEHYLGIVQTLKWQSRDVQRDDSRIFTGLTEFISRNISRGEIPTKTE